MRRFLMLSLPGVLALACNGDEDSGTAGNSATLSGSATATDGDTDPGSTATATVTATGTDTAGTDSMGSMTASETSPTDSATDSSATATATDTASEGTATDTSDTDSTSGDDSGSDDDSTSGPVSDSNGNTGNENCQAPGEHITCDDWGSNPTPLQAIGLNCPGDATNSTQTLAQSWTAPDNQTYRIGTQYGTSGDWVPTEGQSLLVISSGRIPAPNNQGVITNTGVNQTTNNPDGQQLPPPMSANRGSNNGNGGTPFMNCDGVNDCSDSLFAQWQLGDQEANDLLWFDFTVTVPEGTTGWEMDLVYFSNEFPEWVGDEFNDMFVVWESSEAYTGNVCFVDNQPCTVTALDTIADAFSGPQEGQHPSLAGTGTSGLFDTGGQTTGWVSLKGPAEPLEDMELTFALFDMGDDIYDTMVVLDNWRWDCQGCIPNEVDSCGVVPQ